MRIGIDAREIQNGVFTGIGRPLANFLSYFSKLDTDDKCVIFSSKRVPAAYSKNIKNVVIKESFTFYWDQIALPRALKKENIEIFYSPYYKIPLSAKCVVISSVLDLMYLVFDEYKKQLGPFKRLYYSTFGKKFAQSSAKILTCSQYSKNDIIKIYGVEDNKIDVIPLSISDVYRPCRDKDKIEKIKGKYFIDSGYILYLGNFKPHKNVKRLIYAFGQIVPEFNDLKLILAGPKEHLYNELVKLGEKLGISDKLIFTGKILEEDKPNLLYSGAELFIMPSFYEGFGLPTAEAMSCGTPVVASNCASIPEVVKDAGILVNPYDIDAMSEAIKSILKDKDFRENLTRKGIEYSQEYYEEKINKRMYEYFKGMWEQNR